MTTWHVALPPTDSHPDGLELTGTDLVEIRDAAAEYGYPTDEDHWSRLGLPAGTLATPH